MIRTLIFLFLFVPALHAQPISTFTAVIHHSGNVDLGDNFRIYRDYYRKVKGEVDVPYHYVIDSDGRIHKGRSMEEWAWDYGPLAKYLNIALSGGPDYTSAQIAAVNMLLDRWLVYDLVTHSENCPGGNIAIVCEDSICRMQAGEARSGMLAGK